MSNKPIIVSLDNIESGSKLNFQGAESAVVVSVWSQITAHNPIIKNGYEYYIAQARIHADHGNGVESYHTFRYDGVSHHHHEYDITHIENN